MATEGMPGSMVILCTDGLANRGLGAIDSDPEKALQFYNEIGAFAKERGVAISVITIKGEGCRMDILQTLAEQTMGNVTRVNPENLSKDFASILSDEVVGTNVSCQA
jgi:Mg-chelatase subunit ChlD